MDVADVGALQRGGERLADAGPEESSRKRGLDILHADAVVLIPAVRRCRQIRLAIGGRRHHFDVEAGALQSLAETEDRGRRTTVGNRRRKVRRDVKDARGQISKCPGC